MPNRHGPPAAAPNRTALTKRTKPPKPTETSRASRDAPEPDSQSTKNTTQRATQHPAPPNSGDASPCSPNLHLFRDDTAQPPKHGPKARPWRRTGSNRRPPACKAGALPTELRPHTQNTPQQQSRPPHQPKHGGPGRTRTSDPTLIKRVL